MCVYFPNFWGFIRISLQRAPRPTVFEDCRYNIILHYFRIRKLKMKTLDRLSSANAYNFRNAMYYILYFSIITVKRFIVQF